MHACPRADIHDIVRQTNCIFIVLDHYHGIADVAKVFEGAQQTIVIALMQADRRLIKDVKNTHQARADLAGQTDTLRLAAGQCVSTAIQRQIIEAHIHQKLQAFANFFQNFVCNLAATPGQAQRAEIFSGIANGHVGHGRQVFLTDPYVTRFTTQACAAAVGASLGAEKLGQLLTNGRRLGFAIAPLKVRHDPFKRVRPLDDVTPIIEIAEINVLRAAAVQNDFLFVGGQFAERHFKAEIVMLGQRTQHLEVIDVTPVPAANGALSQGQITIDQSLDVEKLLNPEPVAGRACTGRVVEGKQFGFQLADSVPANGASEACRKNYLFAGLVVHRRHQRDTVSQLERGLKRFGQALLQIRSDLEAVNDHVNRVFLLLVELWQLIQFAQLAVYARANEALSP